MDHNDIRHKLSEYIDNSVTPDEKTAIEEHLKTCTSCTDALRELRKTIENLHAVEEVQPPSWMTQKIMAKVREEQEKRSGILGILFNYFVIGRAIRVAAVIFLTVTVYYIYSSMHPAEKYAEAPVGHFAKQEMPARERDAAERKAAEVPAEREKKVVQEPGYKSLDMKYSYEKPAPPAPAEQPAAAAAPAKEQAHPAAKDEADLGKRAAAPKAAAPSLMAEQAAPAAGAARSSGTEQTLTRKAESGSPRDLEAEALLDVTEHFAKTDLPEKMKVKGLRYAARKFEKGLADLSWMEEMGAFRSSPCIDRYVVDVDLSGNRSTYLYCYDNSQVRLLGTFELRNGKWSEIK